MLPLFRGLSVILTASLAASLLLAAGGSRRARACGGFFCDRPPTTGALPIAQNAENVLFVLDTDPETGKGRVEAHIQILYTGTAAQFSWVVPVTATPTLDVGNDVLFDRLEPLTRPSYRLKWGTEGTCQGLGGGGGGSILGGCGGSGSSAVRLKGGVAGGDTIQPPVVQVLFRGNVGPYDSAVVKSDDPGALKTWLTDNGYFVSDDAARIVDDYVAAHSSFVALRLRQGQDTSAIQPIILRLPAEEACLPLKLTAIAATPDVRINVWVLGSGRAVPINYTEIGLNFSKLDWFGSGKNYNELLGQAADEAGGNAFAVEYAQPTLSVAAQFMISPGQQAVLTETTEPGLYIRQLTSMGFALQGAVLQVLRKDLPVPAPLAEQGVTEADFYQNIDKYWLGTGNTGPSLSIVFDPRTLTSDLAAAVFTPLLAFAPLFQNQRTLTRLATFISPDEMNRDPIFVTNSDLPDVSPLHNVTATILCGDQQFDTCHAPVRVKTEDGNEIVYPVASGSPNTCNPQVQPTYDRGDLDTLPASTVGFARSADSPGTVSVDNRPTIATALNKHNAAVMSRVAGSGDCGVAGRGRPALPIAAPTVVALAWAWRRKRKRKRKSARTSDGRPDEAP